jgi:hypothetical protein
MKLSNGYSLKVIPNGVQSPIANHSKLEIEIHDESKTFYIHELMLNTYGVNSVVKSCELYIGAVE